MKTSFGDFSADDISVKIRPVAKNWVALQAGNDVTDADFITGHARELLKGNPSPTPIEAANALQEAYTQRTRQQAEARVLARYGYTWESFQTEGRTQLTDKTLDKILGLVADVNLSMEFILAGFDERGQGHLFNIHGQTAPASWDASGFCAIGSGTQMALGSLSLHVDLGNLSRYIGWAKCVYCVCDAKFRAESAQDVGKRTFLAVYERDQDTKFISPVRIDNELRKSWILRGAAPKAQVDAIPDKAFTARDLVTPDGKRRFLGPKRPNHRQMLQEYEAVKRAIAHQDEQT